MDKLLRDMDALCQTTAKEREEMYRKNCIIAEIMWKEQQLTDEEMDKLRVRHDKTCDEAFDEILRNMINELQGMADLLEYMNMIEDCDIDDMLNQLNANISAYNEGT